MATLDTTRFGFEPDKRYTGTRMQQGRVLTDDDYNDSARIQARHGWRVRLKQPELTVHVLIDKLVAFGCVSVGDVDEIGPEPLVSELELDPEVAERPQDLVVYGGIGKAARNWACFDAIVDALKALGYIK